VINVAGLAVRKSKNRAAVQTCIGFIATNPKQLFAKRQEKSRAQECSQARPKVFGEETPPDLRLMTLQHRNAALQI
jgi:hypothetical protein